MILRLRFFFQLILLSGLTGLLFCPDTTYSSNTTLSSDLRLSLASRAIFNATLTLDGAGFYFQMPITPDQVFLVNNGFTATTQNLLINDFVSGNLSLGTGSSVIFGTGTVINTLLDQTLTQTLQFSGNVYLRGVQNSLDLGSGAISVLANSSLTISNMNLINVVAKNLGCVDDTGSIIFQNVTLSTPSQWNFNKGSFLVKNYFEVTDGLFCYTSGMASTVDSNSTLLFSSNLNFSYDPVILSGYSVASQTNLAFTDTSSWLILDGATLYVTTTGMQLLKGSLGIIGKNSLYADSTLTPSRGLCFGDGLNANNDFRVVAFNSATSSIDVKTGFLTYQSINN